MKIKTWNKLISRKTSSKKSLSSKFSNILKRFYRNVHVLFKYFYLYSRSRLLGTPRDQGEMCVN